MCSWDQCILPQSRTGSVGRTRNDHANKRWSFIIDLDEVVECMTGCLGIKEKRVGIYVLSDRLYTYNQGYEAALHLLNQLGSEIDGDIAEWSEPDSGPDEWDGYGAYIEYPSSWPDENRHAEEGEYPHAVEGEYISTM